MDYSLLCSFYLEFTSEAQKTLFLQTLNTRLPDVTFCVVGDPIWNFFWTTKQPWAFGNLSTISDILHDLKIVNRFDRASAQLKLTPIPVCTRQRWLVSQLPLRSEPPAKSAPLSQLPEA